MGFKGLTFFGVPYCSMTLPCNGMGKGWQKGDRGLVMKRDDKKDSLDKNVSRIL